MILGLDDYGNKKRKCMRPAPGRNIQRRLKKKTMKTITTIPSGMTFRNGKIHLILNKNEYCINTIRSSRELARLEIGKGVDEDINVERKEGNLPYGDIKKFHKYVYNRVERPKKELRFVVEDNIILDITSKQHSTYSEKKMEKYISSHYNVVALSNSFLQGIIVFVREKEGIKYYVQIYPGNILTTQAMQVCSCYKIYGFYISSFRHKNHYTKVKRVAVVRDMEETMKKAIDDKIKQMKESDFPSHKVPISEGKAKELLHQLLSPKQIMDSAIDEILYNFSNRPKTTTDLAIACAQTATIGESMRTNNARQKISTAGHEILVLENKEGIRRLMEN